MYGDDLIYRYLQRRSTSIFGLDCSKILTRSMACIGHGVFAECSQAFHYAGGLLFRCFTLLVGPQEAHAPCKEFRTSNFNGFL